jgi:hypothetical protein
MLTFSATQMNDIAQARRRGFIDSVARWLDDEFPGRGWLTADGLSQLQRWAEQAWAWGIQHDELVRCHLYASVVLGDGYFQLDPDVEAVLANADLSDELKLAWLTGLLDALRAASSAPGA